MKAKRVALLALLAVLPLTAAKCAKETTTPSNVQVGPVQIHTQPKEQSPNQAKGYWSPRP